MQQRWRSLADAASEAFGSDFRYAEEMARQAVNLKERQQARAKKSEDQHSKSV